MFRSIDRRTTQELQEHFIYTGGHFFTWLQHTHIQLQAGQSAQCFVQVGYVADGLSLRREPTRVPLLQPSVCPANQQRLQLLRGLRLQRDKKDKRTHTMSIHSYFLRSLCRSKRLVILCRHRWTLVGAVSAPFPSGGPPRRDPCPR